MPATPDAATEPTDDQIDAAILAALADTDEELVPWAELREGVPGFLDRRMTAFVRLWLDGRIWAIKIRGRNYLALGDQYDVASARRRPDSLAERTPQCL